jgi:hypothetical protein
MNEPIVRFPITCPKCGKEQLDEYPVAEVAAALLSGGKLRLLAACHRYTWNANPTELEQIREYLGVTNVDAKELPSDNTSSKDMHDR